MKKKTKTTEPTIHVIDSRGALQNQIAQLSLEQRIKLFRLANKVRPSPEEAQDNNRASETNQESPPPQKPTRADLLSGNLCHRLMTEEQLDQLGVLPLKSSPKGSTMSAEQESALITAIEKASQTASRVFGQKPT